MKITRRELDLLAAVTRLQMALIDVIEDGLDGFNGRSLKTCLGLVNERGDALLKEVKET
jgi:hypothetical protein